MAGLQYNKR